MDSEKVSELLSALPEEERKDLAVLSPSLADKLSQSATTPTKSPGGDNDNDDGDDAADDDGGGAFRSRSK